MPQAIEQRSPTQTDTSSPANRRRREPVDLTVDMERQAFIDRYLQLRAHEPSDVNRLIVDCGVASYPEPDLATRRDLTGYLDQIYSLHRF